MGTKTVGVKTLTAVVFQGDQYGDKGWQQNVTVNEDGVDTPDQASYKAAAESFLADLDAMRLAGDGILWITGQSRGGAIANLAGAYLLDRSAHPELFCYTFESPATTENPSAKDDKYQAIHNYVCSDDPVTMLPLWDMVRYGQDVAYDTDPAEDVIAMLAKINPDAYEKAQAYNPGAFDDDPAAFVKGLLDQLEEVVPAREAYSQAREAGFTEDGTETKISYTYQLGLQTLCHVIFGSEGELTSKLSPLLDLLPDLALSRLEEAYVSEKGPENKDELLSDAARLRWNAAAVVAEKVNGDGTGPVIETEGVYALLSLLSPMVVDTSAVSEEGWEFPSEEELADALYLYMDLSVLMDAADNALTLVFSHHPDVILARLSLLAPALEMEDMALVIADPGAGDAADAAPAELEGKVDALNLSWLSCEEVKWLTEDDPLQDGKLYYLQMTVVPVGHTVPDDLSITVNGQDPVEYSVSYEKGPARITGSWEFPIGTVEQVAVTFDANGHGETPDAWTVDKGMQLRNAGLTPEDPGIVRDDEGSWRFDGWFDDAGTPWDELTANGDVVLTAHWTEVIDEIVLTYEIPRVGDSGDAILQVSVPNDALYWIDTDPENLYVMNQGWEGVDRIEDRSDHYLSFMVRIPDGIEFLTKCNEYGDLIFAGPLTVNGEQTDRIPWVSTEEDWDTGEELYDYIQIDYTFTPAARSSRPSAPEEPSESAEPEEPAGSDEPAKKFVDVPEDAWYEEAVDWAVENNVTAGTDETHFSPNASCTRAQAMTMLWSAAGAPEQTGGTGRFADVAEDAYYADAVQWAVENNITSGVNADHFAPAATVTRAQVIMFLYRLAGSPSEGSCPFTDVPEDAYYHDAVCWAYGAGVTAGTGNGRFSPDAQCTRAQIVTLLYLALGQN